MWAWLSDLSIEVMQASENQYLPGLKNIEDEVEEEEEESSWKQTSESIRIPFLHLYAHYSPYSFYCMLYWGLIVVS